MQAVDNICQQLNSAEQVKVFQGQKALAQLVASAGTPSNAAARAELATALAAELVSAHESKDAKGNKQTAPKRSAAVRNHLARGLADVGGDMEVPALKKCLADFEVREMARWALDRINCQAATDALADAAVNSFGTEFRVGAVNALGRKSGSGVIAALKQCLADSDLEVCLAAVESLANHADASIDEAITSAVKPGAGKGAGNRVMKRVAKARIRLAENLDRSGQRDAAKKIYQSLASAEGVDEAQKKAAGVALAHRG
jgi:hypothetical protein